MHLAQDNDVVHTFTPDDVLGRSANFVEDQRRRVISGLKRQKHTKRSERDGCCPSC